MWLLLFIRRMINSVTFLLGWCGGKMLSMNSRPDRVVRKKALLHHKKYKKVNGRECLKMGAKVCTVVLCPLGGHGRQVDRQA